MGDRHRLRHDVVVLRLEDLRRGLGVHRRVLRHTLTRVDGRLLRAWRSCGRAFRRGRLGVTGHGAGHVVRAFLLRGRLLLLRARQLTSALLDRISHFLGHLVLDALLGIEGFVRHILHRVGHGHGGNRPGHK